MSTIDVGLKASFCTVKETMELVSTRGNTITLEYLNLFSRFKTITTFSFNKMRRPALEPTI